jgi:hypothetical protein
MAKATPETAASLYQTLSTSREPFLTKARESSALTLPFLCPPQGAAPGADYTPPFQSVGARGVVNLAAKLLLALLPPNQPFFKLAIDRFELKKLEQDPKTKTMLDAALSEIEQATQVEIETSATRVTTNEAFLHLVVTGNALLEIPDEGNLKVYRLDRYVVQRDPMGHVLTIVIHETVAPCTLEPEVQKALGKDTKEKVVDLYTVCKRSKAGGMWEVYQEVGKGVRLPDSDGTYPEDKCPFIPLRFNKIDSEDYGRGFVEQYLGDLNSLETLTQAVVMGAVAAAKIVFLVKPNGLTDPRVLAEANNGDFVAGQEEDVHALQLDKFADLRVAYEQGDRIEKRLETAFLLYSGVQRDAERVTAEEVRALIQELETSLGGVYSVLAQDFQLPLASALMARMAKDKRLPKLPKKIVRPSVTTGLDALGRGNDAQKLRAFLADAAQTLGPEVVARYLNPGEYLARQAAAQGITTKGLVRSDEELAAEAQQQQQAQMAQSMTEKLGPAVIREAGNPESNMANAMSAMAAQQPTA